MNPHIYGQLSTTKEARTYKGENTDSLISGTEKTGQQHEKHHSGPLSHTIYRNKFKTDQIFQCKT